MNRIALAGLISAGCLVALTVRAAQESAATIVSKDNQVDVSGAGGTWSPANAGQALTIGDRLKTGEDSRASVRMADGSMLQLDELTTIEIKPPQAGGGKATLGVPGGAAYYSNKGKSREVNVETPSANGAIRGTAFLLKVNRYDGRTSVSMMEGEFELSNMSGVAAAVKGEQSEIGFGAAPTRAPLSDRGNSGPWYLVVESKLQTLRSLSSADRGDFFNALPAVTKQWRFVSPQLAGASVLKKKEWSKEILESSFRAVGPDCPLLKRILVSCIAANPEAASELTERAMQLFPKCADEFQDAASGAGKGDGGGGGGAPVSLGGSLIGAPPGISGTGAQGNFVIVCFNGRSIIVSAGQAEEFLRTHPGATLGSCQVTPFQNR